MRSLPLKAQLYIVLILLSTVCVAGYAVSQITFTPLINLQILLFALAICVADAYPIALPLQENAEVSMSSAIKTAAVLIFGLPITIVVTLVGTLLSEVWLRRSWYKALFNVADITLTFAVMSIAYELIYDGARSPFHSLQNAAGVCAMILTYYVVNIGLVTIILSLTTGASFWHVWKANFRDVSWNILTIIPLGAVMAFLWDYRPWSVVVLVLPMIVVRQSFQFIAELQQQTRAALVSLADTIDQRDPDTFQHSQRVARLAEAIAEAMELPYEELEVVRMAGRLHDLGKIGMSNALLFKPGRFDAQETAEFRRHPTIGAELVRSFRLFNEGQVLIRCHHECYDGTGYPANLAGEAIPVGSRILAVADSFDAMTSRRVYQAAKPIAVAMEELVRRSGSQFDPAVVAAFQRVITAWDGVLPWQRPEVEAAASAGGTPLPVLNIEPAVEKLRL
jgi:putative nucleotidyltransferase with HDIG domain